MKIDTITASEFKPVKTCLIILALVGIVLTFFQVGIYRMTIIDWKILFSLYIITGILSTFLNHAFLSKHYDTQKFIHHLIYNTLTFGGIILYSFLALNYYLSKDESSEFHFPIKKKSWTTEYNGKRNKKLALVTVDCFKQEKELFFEYSQIERINSADSVILKISKGALGIDVIDDYNVLKK